MQHSYRTKGWAKRLGAMAMTLVMLFGLMAAGLPQAQAVTQDDINNLKSQAASLSSQKADIQKKLDKLSNSKNSALNEKLLLEQKINVLRSEIAVSDVKLLFFLAIFDRVCYTGLVEKKLHTQQTI